MRKSTPRGSPLHKDEQTLVPQEEHAAVIVDEAVKVGHNSIDNAVGQCVLREKENDKGERK
jgi:hypothetical protein